MFYLNRFKFKNTKHDHIWIYFVPKNIIVNSWIINIFINIKLNYMNVMERSGDTSKCIYYSLRLYLIERQYFAEPTLSEFISPSNVCQWLMFYVNINHSICFFYSYLQISKKLPMINVWYMSTSLLNFELFPFKEVRGKLS